MDTADLVRLIVAEVLKNMPAQSSQAQPAPAKECVRVFAPRSQELVRRIAPLVDAFYGEGTALVFSKESLEGCKPVRFILPELTCADMADLAIGRACSETANEILSLVLRGEQVDVLAYEYQRFAETAPRALYDLYASYAKTLLSFGLKPFEAKQPDSVRVHALLVTASMVEKAAAQGISVLKIASKAKITPLAEEAAAQLAVSFVRD